MVLFPDPPPAVERVTPAPALSRMSLDPARPVVSELPKLAPMSNEILPTVIPAAPPSLVTVRAAVGLVKMAVAPTAFGTMPVSQFGPEFQLPPAPGSQISARADHAAPHNMAAAKSGH